MSKILATCPDYGAPVGERHRAGCDIERCPHWWPGEEDCERFDFFVNDDPDFLDLNRLFTDSARRGHRAVGREHAN